MILFLKAINLQQDTEYKNYSTNVSKMKSLNKYFQAIFSLKSGLNALFSAPSKNGNVAYSILRKEILFDEIPTFKTDRMNLRQDASHVSLAYQKAFKKKESQLLSYGKTNANSKANSSSK
ncbi:MAG: hypothetical protein ACK5B9_00410 [Flavobacteriia bacterium]|jgi:hypothetical protein